MKIIGIVEHKVWKHTVTGREVSIYGAVPWYTKEEKEVWKLQVSGYTWKLDNGTIGLGRKPVATRKEAVEIMHEFNNHQRISYVSRTSCS